MAIERAFGILKKRFPLFKFGLRFKNLLRSANCITAGIVIDNICILKNDFYEVNVDPTDQEEQFLFENYNDSGIEKRNNICERFN